MALPYHRPLDTYFARGLDLRFAANAAMPAAPTITSSGGANGTRFDSAGDLVDATTPRFDFEFGGTARRCKGLLIEEARTNSLRNNTMVGAATGTPGTSPNNWTITDRDVTVELVAVDTINGIKYVSYRFSGTPTGNPDIRLETVVAIDALINETWTVAAYVALVAGDLTNISAIKLEQQERTEAGTWLKTNVGSNISGDLTATLQRFSYTATLSEGTTAHVMPDIAIFWDGSGDIDLTLRIGLPQEEQGAGASSIVKTSSAAVTRTADVVTMNVSDFGFDADKGTFLMEGSFPFTSTAARAILTIDDGGTTDRFYFELDASENVNFSTTHSADTDGASNGSAVIAVDTQFKIVAAYADDDVRAAVDGTLSPADSTAALPLADTMTTVRFGADSAGNYFNGHFARLAYYPGVRHEDGIIQVL